MKKNYLIFTLFFVMSISFGQVSTSGNLNKSLAYGVNMPTDQNKIDGFTVYPNPVTNGNFRLMSLNGGSKDLQIFDMLGKRVLKKRVRQNETVQVDNLNPGIYILKVEEEGKTVTRKLVIE